MTNLPSGTITFLFTDIEGSTKLLQTLGADYESLLADQRDIMRASFETWRGQEVDTQGDAFFVAFPRASDGVAAAAEIQRNLAAHSWLGDIKLKVRMGLHTGEPVVAREGYVGMDVHRAARIAHIGHGGQVLLSESVVALVREQLPHDVSILDLGAHQLKDLSRPEPVYQLALPRVPNDFPPLNSLDLRPNNLPTQLTSFVGRQAEIDQVKSVLRAERLVTLTGPGGTGKTRLSIQVAADLVDDFPDGVWLVELEPIQSTDYLVPAIASAMQFATDGHSSDLDPEKQLVDYLSKRSLLLILDNFEHLVDGAGLVTKIAANTTGVKILVTSREKLNVQEEWSIPISGMTYPKNGDEVDPDTYSGLTLFLQRARQVNPKFDFEDADIPCASRVCQLVEGMPLGIELAAGWTSMLSCEEIADEIEKSIDFLESSMRGTPDKHRSLRAVFEESWRRLDTRQQVGLRQLAIFTGGFSRAAAAEVAGVALPLLAEFSNKSLLHRDEGNRFEMHALLKAYALEKLHKAPEDLANVQEKHARYYVGFLKERAETIQGEDLVEIREQVRREIGNVRQAIRWACVHWDTREARAALLYQARFLQTEGFHESMELNRQLAKFLGNQTPVREELLLLVQVMQGVWGATIGDPDSIELIEIILPDLKDLGEPLEYGLGLLASGIGLEYQSEFRQAIEILEESFELLDGLGEEFPMASCLSWLGWAHFELGEYDQAGRYFLDGLQRSEESNNVMGLPYMLSKMGTWADAIQNYSEGLEYHQDAQKYFRMIGDQAGQGYALSRMSLSAWGLGDYEDSLKFGQDGFDQFDAIGHRWGRCTSMARIGFAQIGLGQYEQAHNSFEEALKLSQEYSYQATSAYALVGLASLWAVDREEAQAVETLTMVINYPGTPALYRDIGQAQLLELESRLSPVEFSEAHKRGKAADFETSIKALQKDFKRPRTRKGS